VSVLQQLLPLMHGSLAIQDDDGETWYKGYEASVQCVREALTRMGPFDGLLGFSQVSFAHDAVHILS